MGEANGNKKLSIRDSFLQNPRQYSFENAVQILSGQLNASFGKELTIRNAVINTHCVVSFHLRGTEIEKIREIDGKPTIFIERLTLAGLNSPLPTPYSEIIYNRKVAQDFAISDFVNIFHSRLLGISYQISKKRYANLNGRNDFQIMHILPNFFGDSFAEWSPRLSRLVYLFWTKEKSEAGLAAIIHYLFGFDTRIEQCVTQYISGQTPMHLGKCKLGKNSDLGKGFYASNLDIVIHLTHKDDEQALELIDKSSQFSRLKKIIKRYLKSYSRFSIKVRPNKIPSRPIGQIKLGKTSWLPGKHYDEVMLG
ncbi:MAG: type VI secretion system baseplate subunit TssG [Alphaproteobacteria bacterium]|nr:type VI secretion system baseplate subunit TssG [Alphaproteobacteria bacterium]